MVTISVELLKNLIEYIEDVEEQIDGEWGLCRLVKQLIEEDAMPELYHQLKAIELSLNEGDSK